MDNWAEEVYAYIMEFTDLACKQTISRGLSYARGGNVVSLKLHENGTIEGDVLGTHVRPYKVYLRQSEDFEYFAGECSCGPAIECKHCYAVAIRILAELYYRAPAEWEDAAEYLPAPWRKANTALPPVVLEGGLALAEGVSHREDDGFIYFINEPEDEDASTPTAQPAVPAPAPWWRQVLNASTQHQIAEALKEGLSARTLLPEYALTWTVQRLMRQSANRVALLQTFEDHAAGLAEERGRALRPDRSGLTEWLDSEECIQLTEKEQKEASFRIMEDWLRQTQPDPSQRVDQVEFVWHVASSPPPHLPTLWYQVLLTSKKLRRSPRRRQAIDQLACDIRCGNRVLPAAQASLLQWLASNYRHTLFDQDDRFAVSDAMAWLTGYAHRGLITWEDTGNPVHFDPAPAQLTITRKDDVVMWATRLKEGEAPVPLDQLALVSDEGAENAYSKAPLNVFIHTGDTLRRLETGGIPLALLEQANQSAALPAGEIRARGLGQPLLAHLRTLGTLEEEPIVHEVPVQPRIEFYLNRQQHVRLRATALTPEGRCFVRQGPNDWRATTESAIADTEHALVEQENVDELPQDAPEPTENAAAIAERPRMADLEPAEGWLRALIPAQARPNRMPAGQPCVDWYLPDMGIQEFLELWDKRPPRVNCYGNKAMRDLISLRTPPEFKLNIESSGVQWLTVSVEMQNEVDALSYADVEAALRAQDAPNILLPKRGRYRREELEAYQERMRTLAELGISLRPGEHRVHALQVGAVPERSIRDETKELKRFIEEAKALQKKFRGIPRAKVSKKLDQALRSYQQAGVDFCAWACKTFGGAILADDMGLGKTLQVLAAFTVLRKGKRKKKPALVVCPASVTHNWQREAARFTPKLRTLVLESGAQRTQLLQQAEQYDMVIKNYALARRDIDHLQAQAWSLVCVDEAQAIKNPDAATSRALKSLDAEYRIALTGTPIENRLTDLWSIVDFAVPGYLPDRDEFEKGAGNQPGPLEYQRLRARLRPILLRRLKSEVAPELPERIEERLDCPMTPAQRKAYAAELKQAQLLLQSAKNRKVGGQDRIQILAALTRLRQLCCDPALRQFPKAGSGKVDVFLERLQGLIDSGHKVLVFSQFVKMLDILAARLKEQGIPYYTLTGKTRKRQELVNAYEADTTPSAFLVSLKAGGSGLNLVSASYVILFDPWWNPAVEAQAIDRTHRIGQDKTVVAYRLVTEDSIEERILELQEKKRGMVANVLEADAFNRSLTRDDFAFILE
ncbi:MAG: SNF2-related protein [Candidatus Hydrogenedentota bacterium]